MTLDADHILVIKHGALGDFVLSLPAMAAIRARFPKARITLQTTPALVALAEACPYFDDVDGEGRPKGAFAMFGVAARVRGAKYDIVYDLQNSERTGALQALLPFGPKWNGIAGGGPYKVRDRHRLKKHAIDRHAEQIALTGIPIASAQTAPDMSWAAAKGARPETLGLTAPYLMLAARASAGHRAKQWPAERFAAVARRALAQGLTPALVGAPDEFDGLQEIADAAPGALNLAGKTSLLDLASLGANAQGMLGNDTGPAFVAAASGAPAVVLYSRHSLPPELCAPRGERGVIALSGRELTDITIDAAEQALASLGVLKA